MAMDRRQFLGGLVGAGATLGFPLIRVAEARRPQTLTILHTNDTHSRIDPFQEGKFKGQGGVARRATLIAQIKQQNPATLVLDAGDVLQGTPYFNMFHGSVEFEAMRRMGYDMVAIGNHDFDKGAQRLLFLAKHHGKFPLVCANLLFSQPGADKLVRPYLIKDVGGWKVGVFGLGVRFRGLVPAKLHQGVTYASPIPVAQKLVKQLREVHRCDAVIALSHLGYVGFDGEPGDQDLARQVPGIDIIIGGHTHTFLMRPTQVKAPDGRMTRIYQVGHSGLFLGRIDLSFVPRTGLEIREKNVPVDTKPSVNVSGP